MHQLGSLYRSHTCGELRPEHVGQDVVLLGWVHRVRDMGAVIFLDIRDRYGVTQVVTETEPLLGQAKKLKTEMVVAILGTVAPRAAETVNDKLETGHVEVRIAELRVLNDARRPPFAIADESFVAEDTRLRYRYLDLRRQRMQKNLMLRHRVAMAFRRYFDANGFLEIETPILTKSTPEGARDYLVPSRVHPGEFFALPQSPQLFKQILMIGGLDRYFQIVKCFRDEDLRQDRQPEFTQIDCEMAFVEQEDILRTFEGMAKHLFKTIHGVEFEGDFPRMSFDEAMKSYGCDKPDLRFGMKFQSLTPNPLSEGEGADLVRGHGFKVFDDAELVVGINAEGCAGWSRKQTDALIDFVKRPQIGATGIVFVKWTDEGLKSTVDKFFTPEQLQQWSDRFGMKKGDLLCIMAGKADKTRKQLNELRLHLGDLLGLRDPKVFKPLWVIDFPLLEQDEETGRWHAMHHPFTAPKPEDAHKLMSGTELGSVRANAYDLVINGTEIGGGSIRIHDRTMQEAMFRVLGFTDEDARYKFGFLMDAFEYGAPPHGGAAFGFDRLVSLFGYRTDIREFIAFPKNNAGRDTMIDAPSRLDADQLKELGISSLD